MLIIGKVVFFLQPPIRNRLGINRRRIRTCRCDRWRHCMGNTVAVQTKVNFSVTFKSSYHHRRTTSLYRHPPEGGDLDNGWVGSHSVTLLSDCTVTVQPILEWKKPKSFVYAVRAFELSFSKAKRVVTNVYSLAERKTLQFNFLAHLDKGVSQEIFGRWIERLSYVICYHFNSLV